MLRRFELVRNRDPSGVTGTGVVAHGVQFGDGWVALQWVNSPNPVPVPYVSMEALMAIHGHDGATVVKWTPLSMMRTPS